MLIRRHKIQLRISAGAFTKLRSRVNPHAIHVVRALARYIVLCSWKRHLTLTVPPFTQEYKWVPASCWGNLTNCGGVTCDELASRPWGISNTPSRFMLQKPISSDLMDHLARMDAKGSSHIKSGFTAGNQFVLSGSDEC